MNNLKYVEDIEAIKHLYSPDILDDIKDTIKILNKHKFNYNNLKNVKLLLYSGILNAIEYLKKNNCQKIQVIMSNNNTTQYYYNKYKNKYSINVGYENLKKYKDLYFRFVGNNVYDDTILLNYICSCEKNNCNCTIIISNDKFSDIELRHKNNIYTFLFVDDGKFIVPLLQ